MLKRPTLNGMAQKVKYISFGVLLTLVIVGAYMTVKRIEALKVAWLYPTVVAELKINEKLSVVKK